jgi:DNA-binding MarR family transcriptional regulator
LSITLDLAQFLPYRLSVASNAVSDLIAREYRARFGLKIPEWRIMAVVGQAGAISQREIVTITLMDKVTVSRATAALAERGLLKRQPSTADGRSHQLAFTTAGADLYATIVPTALAMEARASAVLSADDRATLMALLTRLLDHADLLAAEGASDA